jgi:hypothetical protein
MRFLVIVGHYFVWHYGLAIKKLTKIYGNLISFVFNFFSVPVLVASYFSPWRRLGEDYPDKSVYLFDYFSVFLVNLIMRLLGILMRTVIIVLGMSMTLAVILSYPLILAFWVALPLVVIVCFLIGISLLFK